MTGKTQCTQMLRGKGQWGWYNKVRCTKPAVPGTLFCKIHDPEAIEVRRKKSDQKHEEKQDFKKSLMALFPADLGVYVKDAPYGAGFEAIITGESRIRKLAEILQRCSESEQL